jgi:hypothetical protein
MGNGKWKMGNGKSGIGNWKLKKTGQELKLNSHPVNPIQ